MPYTVFKEGKIFYRVFGKGRPIVLLHGFLGNMHSWEYLIPTLSKRYKVILIDLPGHGKSESFGYIHSMSLMADGVKTVLNSLLLRRYVIIGHSMGGYVALAFAEKYMDNLRGLVLFHSTALADSDEKKIDRKKAIRVVKKNKEKYLNEALKKLFFQETIKKHPHLLNTAIDMAHKTSVQGIIAALEGMIIRKNTEVILQFCNFPVLFIVGLHDKLISMELHEHQFKLPAHNSVLLLEKSAHMGFYEQPDKVLEKLTVFLRKCFSTLEP